MKTFKKITLSMLVAGCLSSADAKAAAFAMESQEKLKMALFHAVMFENISRVRDLIAKGAPVNEPAQSGLTPLHIAAEMCNYKVTKILLESGKVTSLVRDPLGRTPADMTSDTRITQLIEKYFPEERYFSMPAVQHESIAEEGLDTKGILQGSGDFLEMTHNDRISKAVFTFGFDSSLSHPGNGVGCFALYKNGDQRAFLTHYQANQHDLHVDEILRQCAQLNKNIEENPIVKCVVVIIMKLRKEWDDDLGRYAAVPQVKDIRCSAKNGLFQAIINNLKCQCAPRAEYELYSEDDDQMAVCKVPNGTFGNKVVPKEFEIVLKPTPKDSFYLSKSWWVIAQSGKKFL